MVLPPNLSTFPTLGPGDKIGEGDSFIIHNFLSSPSDPDAHPDALFGALVREVHWQTMTHISSPVPRLVCVQAAVDSRAGDGAGDGDGSHPIYRHPADRAPPTMHFSRSVVKICERVEAVVGHPVNHALIQLYRSGDDYISEHADKTLDVRLDGAGAGAGAGGAGGSKIVNVSLGARRTMRLREKVGGGKDGGGVGEEDGGGGGGHGCRKTQRVHLPHDSVFCLGLGTNANWLHGIMPDRRRPEERDGAERAFGGVRVSITLRWIGTWIRPGPGVGIGARPRPEDGRTGGGGGAGTLIYGQGAVPKSRDAAAPTVDDDEGATAALVRAFGLENRTRFGKDGWRPGWESVYGRGSNVVNFASGDGGDHPGAKTRTGKTDIFSSEKVMFFLPPIVGEADADGGDVRSDEEFGAVVGILGAAGVEFVVLPRVVIPLPASPGSRNGPEKEDGQREEEGTAAAVAERALLDNLVMRDVDRFRTEVRGVGRIREYVAMRYGAAGDPSREVDVALWMDPEVVRYERDLAMRDGRRE